MKHIKKFDPLPKPLTYNEWDDFAEKHTPSLFTQNEFNLIYELDNSTKYAQTLSGYNKSIIFTGITGNIGLYKFEDEWYLIYLSGSLYLADQFEEVINYLKFFYKL